MTDQYIHNLRASFLIGLSQGFGIEALIIQYGNEPAPLDYRDYVVNSTSRVETHRHVEDYCENVLIQNQNDVAQRQRFHLGILPKIDLGASAAENESASLGNYFISTAEYSRAIRADHALVIGRKGSGKTAVFYRVRADMRRDRNCCIVELRPSTHNLSELRQALVAIENQGLFDHTIAAFWTYILYTEMLLKIREMVLPLSRRDFDLQNKIRTLEQQLDLDDTIVSGDFTSRLNTAIKDVINIIRNGADIRNGDIKSITNVVYETAIPRLREMTISFMSYYTEICLLIDDIDKGWPPRQLQPHDVHTIKHLIESLRRIERDLRRRDINFRSLIFLRGDVYEVLVDNTPDRGKYNPINVDWSDKAQLERLLRERVFANFSDSNKQDEAWKSFNVTLNDGSTSVDRLIESSLYRPRFLIEASEKVLSTAVNRGHDFITEDDLDHGLNSMSQYLVSDFGYELRDVSGIPEDIFYQFIGVTKDLTEQEIKRSLSGVELSIDLNETIDLLLWYGFLGIVVDDSSTHFIFEHGYDFRRVLALRGRDRDEVLYRVNPAFIRGLDIKQ